MNATLTQPRQAPRLAPSTTSLDRLLRAGALAAVLSVAATLLSLGLYFYRPTPAAASPRPAAPVEERLPHSNPATDRVAPLKELP